MTGSPRAAAAGRRPCWPRRSTGRWANGPTTAKLSALSIRRACEDSLRRLQTDHIDLYQMHHVDRDTPWDEIWQAMGVLIDQGKVLYVGSSNFAGWHIARANAAAAGRNMLGLVSEQSIYNLMTREVELEVLPAAREHGVGIIPWSPLQGGLLGGVLAKQGIRRQVGRSLAALEANRDRIEAYEKLCGALGENPANVGLAWLLHQEGVTAPIIGPRTWNSWTSHSEPSSWSSVDDTLAELDRLFPGYKPAPEHYAW